MFCMANKKCLKIIILLSSTSGERNLNLTRKKPGNEQLAERNTPFGRSIKYRPETEIRQIPRATLDFSCPKPVVSLGRMHGASEISILYKCYERILRKFRNSDNLHSENQN